MKADLLIKGGHIIDTSQNINYVGDVALKGDTIMAVGTDLSIDAATIINANGCIVSPGLIDNHLHMFCDATDAGIDPNTALLPSGVTTGVEGGSPGACNYELYRREVIQRSRVRIKCYLSTASTGMCTRKYPENFDPAFMENDRIKSLFAKYPNELLGLKVRLSKNIVGELGVKPLEAAIDLAEDIGCHVTVHITDPIVDAGDIAQMLRAGDIFCHAFQGKGNTIIGEDGKVKQKVREAQERGVCIDACNGAYNFSISVAKSAIADGFYPDVISTDYNTMIMFRHPVISLPYLMSKYLALGMKIEDIFKACTKTPADFIGLAGKIGTLAPGSTADISVFRLVEQYSEFYDCHGETLCGNELIVPQMTVKSGNIVYRSVEFNREFRE